ncbi:hypothetical protein KY329_00045 [Candidatus Woesearchaeota archaeon]|nr:hypothetical protein [Candidatus Woesearchaeota archaeon]
MKWLLVFLLLLPCAFAATIEQADVTASMEPKSVNISIVYQFSSISSQDVAFSLPLDAKSVTFFYNGQHVDCQLETKEEELRARCGSINEGGSIGKLSYFTKSLVGKLEKQSVFKFTDKLPFKANNYDFTLLLPEGYVIPKENKEEFYLSPDPSEITSDGHRIIIKWSEEQTTRFSNFAIVESLVDDSGFNLALIISLVAIAAALTSLFILVRRKQPVEDTLVPGFIESEQAVVDLIKRAENNELWQKTIQKECGFSKAKVSRIIRNLETRGVVEKIAFGNTNKIKLKNGKEEPISE